MPSKPRFRAVAIPVLFAVGALLGVVWDQLLLRAGAIRYASATWLDQPWWAGPAVGIGLVAAAGLVVLLGDPAPKRDSGRIAGLEGFWLTALTVGVALLDRMPWALFAFLLVALAVRGGVLVPLVAGNFVPALSLIVLAPIAEAMLVTAGAYEYRTSQLGPIPAWLPLLYANSFLFVLRATEAMLQRFGVRRIVEPASAVVPSVPSTVEPDAPSADF